MKKILYIFLITLFCITNFNYTNADEEIITELVDSEISQTYEDETETYEHEEIENLDGNDKDILEEIKPDDPEDVLDTVDVFIRAGEIVIFDKSTQILEDDFVIIDTLENEHVVKASSVLGVLLGISHKIENFSINQIEYYESFDALYIKCVQIEDVELCDNWQYVVNGNSPFSSVEQIMLQNEDTLIFYFGSPYQLIVPDIVTIEEDFVVIAQTYDYLNNTWKSRSSVTIGITIPDPDNPWAPIVLSSYEVDENGQAIFNLETEGEYGIGIEEDWYFPLYPIVAQSKNTPPNNSGGGSSSGGNVGIVNNFNISKALDFLENVQDSRGSFARSDLYTDWAAIAFSVGGRTNSNLFSYIQSNNKSQNLLTDTLRRAMALLILRENPYNFSDTNHIENIIKEFDGKQIGENYLVNDDIFALLVLQKVGYSESDEIISKIISFILSNQRGNGSWENSPDLTAAAIQALYNFSNNSDVNNAIDLAKNYLKTTQQSDGGWGNVYATSWVLLAMNLLGEEWKNNSNTGFDYLAQNQMEDGGLLLNTETIENRIWATSYAIVAAKNTSWIQSMRSFPKQDILISFSATTPSQEDEYVEEEKVNEEIKQEDEIITPVAPAFITSIRSTEEIVFDNNQSEEIEESLQKEEYEENEILVQTSINQTSQSRYPWVAGGLGLIIVGFGVLFGRRFLR